MKMNDVDYVVATSSDLLTVLVGARFTCKRCEFYVLVNIVAQPFAWLAICAVKTLLITLAFYLIEHKIRDRERQRSVIREQIVSKKYALGKLESSVASRSPIVLRREQDDCSSSKSSGDATFSSLPSEHDTPVEKDKEILEAELASYEEKERSMRWGWRLPNIIDRGIRLLTSMAAITHPQERFEMQSQMRRNILSVELTGDDIVALLFEVLEGRPSNLPEIWHFALFYQHVMCNQMCWVIKPQIPEGISNIETELCSQLTLAHNKLKEIFAVYSKSEWLKAISVDEMMKLSSVVSPSSPSSSDQSQMIVAKGSKSTINEANEASRLLSKSPDEVTETCESKTFLDTEKEKEIILKLVADFNALHVQMPRCFEYAILPNRKADARLQPSTLLVGLSLLQSIITLFVYFLDIYTRSQATALQPLQIYQCVYFMIFNSSMPSTLLVNSIYHRDLQQAAAFLPWKSRLLHLIRGPFVIASLLLLAPAFLTHVIVGLILYIWIVIPLIGIPIGLEYILRRKQQNLSFRTIIAGRLCVRIATLFSVAVVLSVAFNAADSYLWQGSLRDRPYMFVTGTYMHQSYLNALIQDYNARSLDCVWEHIFFTISNFLQMGFFLV